MNSFAVIIRDNDIIDVLKDLQSHVNYFTQALEDQQELRVKVIEHIKENFIRAVANNEEESATNPNKFQIINGHFDPTKTLNDYLNLVKVIDSDDEDDVGEVSSKLLLCFRMDKICMESRIEDLTQHLNVSITKMECLDMLGVSQDIKVVFSLKDETKIILSSNSIKKINKEVLRLTRCRA